MPVERVQTTFTQGHTGNRPEKGTHETDISVIPVPGRPR